MRKKRISSLFTFVLVAVALAWVVAVRPSMARSTGRGQYGAALEGLTLDQLRLFRDGREAFQKTEDAEDGLGPIFNDNSCVACHSSPAVGGTSAILEDRAALVAGGSYADLPGGSLFQSNAIRPECAEAIPADANVRARRQAQPLFGLGLIEAIPGRDIEAYAAEQARDHADLAGRVHHVPDPATGRMLVGRFGWKAQQATLLAFSGDAYVNEMGITNRFFTAENAPNGDLAKLARCDAVRDPEDGDDDVTRFANFMRFLAPPPVDASQAHVAAQAHGATRWFGLGRGFGRGSGDGGRSGVADPLDRGGRLFEKVGCGVCHRSGFVARSAIRAIDGEEVEAYSDFLLHDVGTGDGIIQGDAQGSEFRTPPLWGISDTAPYLHDGRAASLTEAIRSHGNQAAAARDAFLRLSFAEQQALLDFLDSI
jgi:CxxC motif-containing protein (DUF1111 family)